MKDKPRSHHFSFPILKASRVYFVILSVIISLLSFPSAGLTYLAGGSHTAFRKAPRVGVEYDKPKLYRFYEWYYLLSLAFRLFVSAVAGFISICYHRQGALCIQQVCLSLRSLSEEDVFLLDSGGLRLYQWNGPSSLPALQYHCHNLALLINTRVCATLPHFLA